MLFSVVKMEEIKSGTIFDDYLSKPEDMEEFMVSFAEHGGAFPQETVIFAKMLPGRLSEEKLLAFIRSLFKSGNFFFANVYCDYYLENFQETKTLDFGGKVLEYKTYKVEDYAIESLVRMYNKQVFPKFTEESLAFLEDIDYPKFYSYMNWPGIGSEAKILFITCGLIHKDEFVFNFGASMLEIEREGAASGEEVREEVREEVKEKGSDMRVVIEFMLLNQDRTTSRMKSAFRQLSNFLKEFDLSNFVSFYEFLRKKNLRKLFVKACDSSLINITFDNLPVFDYKELPEIYRSCLVKTRNFRTFSRLNKQECVEICTLDWILEKHREDLPHTNHYFRHILDDFTGSISCFIDVEETRSFRTIEGIVSSRNYRECDCKISVYLYDDTISCLVASAICTDEEIDQCEKDLNEISGFYPENVRAAKQTIRDGRFVFCVESLNFFLYKLNSFGQGTSVLRERFDNVLSVNFEFSDRTLDRALLEEVSDKLGFENIANFLQKISVNNPLLD